MDLDIYSNVKVQAPVFLTAIPIAIEDIFPAPIAAHRFAVLSSKMLGKPRGINPNGVK